MSNKREMKQVKNLNFLRQILELKSELYDAYSPTITKETKKKAWTTVRDYAVSIGLITNEKDDTYVRDTTWTNLRKRTMEKIDKASITGEGGGPDSKLDSTDEIIMIIIGKESPAIKGLGVNDSMTQQSKPSTSTTSFLNEENIEPSIQATHETATDSQLDSPAISAVFSRKRKQVVVRTMDSKKEFEKLKKEKLALEVLKLKLEVWETEKRLFVQHSELTKDIKPLAEDIMPSFVIYRHN